MRSFRVCDASEGRDNRHTHHHRGTHLKKSVFRGHGEGDAQGSPIPNPRQSLRHRSRPSRSRLRNRRSLEKGRPRWSAWEAELFTEMVSVNSVMRMENMRRKWKMPTKCIGSRAFRVKCEFAVLIHFCRPGLRANACVVNSHRREVNGRARCKSDGILRTSEPVPTLDGLFQRLGSLPHYNRRGTAAYQPARGATVEGTLGDRRSFGVTALLLCQRG